VTGERDTDGLDQRVWSISVLADVHAHAAHAHIHTHIHVQTHTGTNVFTVKVYDVEKNESSKTRNPGPH